MADNSLGHINVGAILSVLLPAGHLRTLKCVARDSRPSTRPSSELTAPLVRRACRSLHQTSLNWEGGLMLAGLINQASGLRSLEYVKGLTHTGA